MKTLKLIQGSPEWLAVRMAHLCASDAPAMMGLSKRTKRSELVRMKATGDQKEFSDWAQKNLLDKGHGTEAKARPIVEEMIGEELYPVTASDNDGRLLASYDGLTMAGKLGFEHKLWNEELAAAIRAGETSFPGGLEWQLEQQALIGGLERIIFVCSDGTREKFVSTEYTPQPKRAVALVAGWKQFEEDVANYKHVETPVTPAARVIPDLPALSIVLDGKVKKSNLEAFQRTALQVIEGIKTDLKTDQDFADAAEMVKFCGDAEKKLELAKESALAQASSIEEIFRALDTIRETMRRKRLELDKLVEKRKQDIRSEILAEGQKAFTAHLEMLNKRLGQAYMPSIAAGFAEAMKGKKSIASLRDAVDTELARQKIAANAIADRMGINLATLRDAEGDKAFAYLFSDLRMILGKENDDFAMLVKARIAEERVRVRQAAEAAAATATVAVNGVGNTGALSAPPPQASFAKVVPLRPNERPSDARIIAALCTAFNASPDTVIGWLHEMDLPAKVPATVNQKG